MKTGTGTRTQRSTSGKQGKATGKKRADRPAAQTQHFEEDSPKFRHLLQTERAIQATLGALREREKGRKAKDTPRARKKDVKGPFHPDKAGFPFEQLAVWLAKRSTSEKVVAIVFSRLQTGDLQSALERSGAYGGQIGDDLCKTWEADIASGELDPEQSDVMKALDFVESAAGL